MSEAFDLVVIGCGNAGMAAAGAARAAGWSVAIVESGVLGGTCSNRGCVPKKVLVAAAEVVDHVRRAHGHGVVGDARIDWSALQRARHAIVDPLPESMRGSLERQGVAIVRGEARFVGPREVQVGDRVLGGKQIVIATGSTPRPLAFPGAALLATSDQVLALDRVPRTCAFIGAGVIAFELGHVLARAGCERVVMLETGARALSRSDADAVAALVEYGRSLGIEVETHAAIEAVDADGSGFVVRYSPGGRGTADLAVDLVAHGAGRVPQLGGLAVERAGLTVEHGRVRLAADLRCIENPDIAIVGDAAADLPQLSPLATSLGGVVGANLARGRHDAPDLRAVPSCVFAIPTLAQVGLTEADAAARGVTVRAVRTGGMTGWISSRTHHEELAFAKVLIDDADQIVGAHLVGHGAEANIHLLAMAMKLRLPAKELGALDMAYPTYPADLRYLLG